MLKKITFKAFLLKQFALTFGLALLVSTIITTVISLIIINWQYSQNIAEITKTTERNINRFLSTGWQPQNLNAISRELNSRFPDDIYHFIKSKQFDQIQRQLLSTNLQQTLHKIEQQVQPVSQNDIFNAELSGGFPIVFKKHCISCHPDIQPGTYAGTVLFSRPISSVILSWGSMSMFFILFIATFSGIGLIMLTQAMQHKVIQPLKQISNRIRSMRVDEGELAWDRHELEIDEIDQIDAGITDNIHHLQVVHDKLDSLNVTEHDSGFFHQDRFKEAF